jgi:hypothetical protein
MTPLRGATLPRVRAFFDLDANTPGAAASWIRKPFLVPRRRSHIRFTNTVEDQSKVVPSAAAATSAEQAVETAGAAAAKSAREIELEAKLADAESRVKKEAEEKENYKQGLLRAKNKKSAKPLDLSDPEAASEHINELVEDKILEKKAEEEAREEHDELERLRVRNAEMERVIKSGLNTSPTSSGSAPVNDPKPRDLSQHWTDEQRQELRNRGMNDIQIKVAEDRARRGDFTSEQSNFLPTRTF